jgi:hypothetical protein
MRRAAQITVAASVANAHELAADLRERNTPRPSRYNSAWLTRGAGVRDAMLRITWASLDRRDGDDTARSYRASRCGAPLVAASPWPPPAPPGHRASTSLRASETREPQGVPMRRTVTDGVGPAQNQLVRLVQLDSSPRGQSLARSLGE